jgi:hypothetical protein
MTPEQTRINEVSTGDVFVFPSLLSEFIEFSDDRAGSRVLVVPGLTSWSRMNASHYIMR